MSRKQKQFNKRLLTIVSKLEELKDLERNNPGVEAPHDLDNQVQKWYQWISEAESKQPQTL